MDPDRKLPKARGREALLVERIKDELLVFDTATNQGHCLNRTAALVFERCDGTSTFSSVAAELESSGLGESSAGLVELAVAELVRANLVATEAPARSSRRVSRRAALTRIGLVAGGVAGAVLVQSIAAPPAWAGCTESGQIPVGGCGNCCAQLGCQGAVCR